MAAYVIADVRVTDPVAYDEYKRQVGATLERYGGRFLVRGGKVQTLEGAWEPQRIALLEFESVEQARAWYDSPEYRPLIALRQAGSEGRLILVESI